MLRKETANSAGTLLAAALLMSAWGASADGGEVVVDPAMHHIRSGQGREWSEFPETAEAAEYRVTLRAPAGAAEQTLRLRHRDVKQTWTVLLNDQRLGRLPRDENPMVTFWPLAPALFKPGENTLRVVGDGPAADDILIGDARLLDRPLEAVLNEAQLHVQVVDGDTRSPLPCRLTIVDHEGSLVTTGAASSPELAVRPGVVYTSVGQARFGLPAGRYTLYAGRGFEYSLAETSLELRAGETAEQRLTIRRVVPTQGYVACDTHCHTVSFSGHGDATIQERMVTLAGEAVELPVATDHNVQIDYEPYARAAGVRRYFTPVIGNEVTTRYGHFNVFPISPTAAVINHQGDWPEVFAAIEATRGVRVVILNHARDIHSGFRPFDPVRHISVAGQSLEGRTLRAGAMEIVNSGALQTDVMQLVHDWFGLLNSGLRITPVGSSDSHDVARHFVGQGRTYIRAADDDPAAIDVAEACESFVAGRVVVSLGLFVEVTIDEHYTVGALVPPGEQVAVRVRVLGPPWTRADQVRLFANGLEIRRATIDATGGRVLPEGVLWDEVWTIERPSHDVFLAATATGPGVAGLYWPIAKAYQPTSPDWTPYVFSLSGPVWLDADDSGTFEPAAEYARRRVAAANGDLARLIALLARDDEAVAVQAARLLQAGGAALVSEEMAGALSGAAPTTRRGFARYVQQWHASLGGTALP